jgi:phage terminase small subunit
MSKDRYAKVLDVKAAALPEAKRQQTNRPPLADKKLNRRQELFVKELVSKDGQITMREAAINAGYPEKSAHVRASELTNPRIHPHVCRAIREYRQELDEKYGVEYQRHLRDLQVIRDAALDNGAFSAAVQAEYRRGQAQGDIYVNKTEIRHGTIDQMSKEEVVKALNEIKQTYAPITHDAGAEEAGNRQRARDRLSGDVEDVVD